MRVKSWKFQKPNDVRSIRAVGAKGTEDFGEELLGFLVDSGSTRVFRWPFFPPLTCTYTILHSIILPRLAFNDPKFYFPDSIILTPENISFFIFNSNIFHTPNFHSLRISNHYSKFSSAIQTPPLLLPVNPAMPPLKNKNQRQ